MVYAGAARNLTKGISNEIIDGEKEVLKTDADFLEKFFTCQGAISNTHFILMVTAACQNVMSIPTERPVFIREYSSNMYGVLAYLFAKFIVELPVRDCRLR